MLDVRKLHNSTNPVCCFMKNAPKDVDTYIESAPLGVQAKLKELRTVIKEVAPSALERISYGMPFYEYNGRLAYFGLAKAHIGLYIPPPVIEEHQSELSDYVTSKGTFRIPLDKDLPVELIKMLVKARMIKNDA
jgi:uncharacterized protein YdhG (YjbR/CyaY superfamily)